MLLINLVAAAVTTANPQSPEALAFAASFQKAIACATGAASEASFDNEQLDRIPREALERCDTEAKNAALDMAKAIHHPDPTLAPDYVAAKMRTAAQERLINRLEAGENLKASNDDGYGLDKAGSRYAFCTRLAINHYLEGVYFGQEWTSAINGLSEEQLNQFFAEIGKSACPVSVRNYAATLNGALNKSDRRTKREITENWNVQKLQSLAVRPYVQMALDIQSKKP